MNNLVFKFNGKFLEAIGKLSGMLFQDISITLILTKSSYKMNKSLVISAFEKAGQEISNLEGKNNPSDVDKATLLSVKIKDLSGAIIGEKRLRQYNKQALELNREDGDISIFQKEVIDGLCKYLGFDSYKSYSESFAKPKGLLDRVKKNRTSFLLLISGSILVIILSSLYFKDQQKWMIWKEDHYEEITFDSKLLADGRLKLFKEDRIYNFKKVTGDCNTIYFNNDGSVKIWYGKNNDGNIECFTGLGLHPETGKTLKPITKYMIKKYLCKNY